MDILVSDSLLSSQKIIMQKQDSIIMFQNIQVTESVRFIDDLQASMKNRNAFLKESRYVPD